MTILGHVQRGGAPTAYDRILASRLAAGATDALARGETGVLIGMIQSKVTSTPIDIVNATKKEIDMDLFELARILD